MPDMTAQATDTGILDVAREQVLERGVPLTQEQVLEVLRTGDDVLQDLLALAHAVRMSTRARPSRSRGSSR